MTAPRKTNIEMVADLMAVSPYGALSEVFVVEAIRHYSEQVASKTPVEDSKALINPVAWHGIAVDIQQRLKENYEPSLIIKP